jgi:tellurite resistance protein TehA-like permease
VAQASVLSLTGQYWKLVAGVGALLVGSLAPLSAASGLNWTTGTILAVVGYAFTCFAVRCPQCEARWFWQAALDASVYAPLFKGSSCPSCKKDFAGSD